MIEKNYLKPCPFCGAPKRLAGHLFEAAEQIAQLQADLERSETKKDSAEVKE